MAIAGKNQTLCIHCDGGARGNPGPAAAAFVVEKNGRVIYEESQYLGVATNNIAEYNAVILAMRWLNNNRQEISDGIVFFLDSELVERQLNGKYKVKNENMRNLYAMVKFLQNKVVKKIIFISVPRAKNNAADTLVNRTLDENL
jgi:ribonuclease HI